VKIAIGGDAAGFPLKGPIAEALRDRGHEVTDFGAHAGESPDFPDVAQVVCDAIRRGEAERAIMVCGTGVGACIAANKIPGIRAALCHDVYSAHQCVEHDDVNVMCLGAQIVGDKLAMELIDAFLKAEFSTEEHFRRRVRKLHEMESRFAEHLNRA
jgi:ribose 5-phosphate isomerase B